jgi:hypothetical protein
MVAGSYGPYGAFTTYRPPWEGFFIPPAMRVVADFCLLTRGRLMGDPYYPWFGLRPKEAYSGRIHRRNRGPSPNSLFLIPLIPYSGVLKDLTYL